MLQAVDIVAGRLTFLAITDREAFVDRIALGDVIAYSIDKELVHIASSAALFLGFGISI